MNVKSEQRAVVTDLAKKRRDKQETLRRKEVRRVKRQAAAA